MLQGKDLFTPPLNLTRATLFGLVRSGKLVPYRKHASLYPDPSEPPGCERIFPKYEQAQLYHRLRWARYQRKWIQEWLAKSPQERRAGPDSTPQPDQDYAKQLRDYEDQIPKYECELSPSNVWQGELGPQHQELMFETLENAWYLDSEIHDCIHSQVRDQKGRVSVLREQILLEPEQIDLLCRFIEAERDVPKGQRGKFVALGMDTGPGHFAYTGSSSVSFEGSTTDAEILAEKGLLGLSSNPSGRPMFHVRPEALLYYRELQNESQPAETVEKEIRGHLNSAKFRREFPDAFVKWTQAETLLWENDSEKQYTTIGHLCREALQEFADILVNRYSPPAVGTDKAKTVSRIRAVLTIRATHMASTEKLFLDHLLGYWGTVSDLVQRQEHGAHKDGEALVWEDARRVVFQTMIVIYEVHRSLTR